MKNLSFILHSLSFTLLTTFFCSTSRSLDMSPVTAFFWIQLLDDGSNLSLVSRLRLEIPSSQGVESGVAVIV